MHFKSFISVSLVFIILFSSVGTVSASERKIVNLLNNDEFGKAVSQLVKEEIKSKKSSSCDSSRVIGKANDNVDFSVYDAEEVVTAEDGRFMLTFKSTEDAEKCIDALSEDEDILYAEPDSSVEPCAEITTNAKKNLSWGSGALQTDQLTDCLKDTDFDSTVTVAIVDSGAADISYLDGHIVEGYDYVDNDSDPSNDTSSYSHGTFLSSIVVDNTGDLPIKIMPVRVISKESSTISNVANGIYYAVDHGADVINLSLGGKFSSCWTIDNAVEYAISKNIAVVSSAGNYCEDTVYYCPAHIEDAITVSAVDSDLLFDESYSNFGSEVDFAAPGTNIIGYNANGKKTYLDGTSMSAAFISACMGILKLLYPTASLNQLESVLADSSVNPAGENKNKYYGFGIPQMMFFSGYTNGEAFLAPQKKNLVIGETYSFHAYSFSDLSPVKNAEWIPNDNSIVKIDSDGTVTALKEGKTEVVCSSGTQTSKCVVNVKKIESISVSELPDYTVYMYKHSQFEPDGIELTVTYSDGTKDIVSDCSKMTFEGFDQNKSGKQNIKVSYYDAEAEFDVSVGFTWWQLLIRILLFGWIWY